MTIRQKPSCWHIHAQLADSQPLNLKNKRYICASFVNWQILKQVIRLILSALILAGVLSAALTTRPVQVVQTIAEAQDNRNSEGTPLSPQVHLQEGYYQSPIQFTPDFPLQTSHHREPQCTFDISSLPCEWLLAGISVHFGKFVQGLLTCIQAQAP